MNPSRVFILSTRNAHKAREIAAILGSGNALLSPADFLLRASPSAIALATADAPLREDSPPGSVFLTLADFPGSPRVVEDGDTFEANARKKAVELARWLIEAQRLPAVNPPRETIVLADDSGLEVEALGGAPGVRSARFSAPDGAGEANSPDRDNNHKLLRLLEEVPEEKRRAQFRCVIAVCPLLAGPGGWRPPDSDHPGAAPGSAPLFSGICRGRILRGPRGAEGFGYDPLFVPDGFDRTFAELGEAEKNALSHRGQALAKLAPWLNSRYSR